MHHTHTTTRLHSTQRRRRGALTLALLLLVALGVLMAAVALDWAYLVLVQRSMQQRTDALALAGAPELLDQQMLEDAGAVPHRDQRDDAQMARVAADEWRVLNNTVANGRFRLDLADLQFNTGHVGDVTQTSRPQFFDPGQPLLGNGPVHNALLVRAVRKPSGRNPVGRLLGQFAGLGAVEVSAQSYAALDSRVIGFQPTPEAPAPVVPLAIDVNAWNAAHGADKNYNHVRELEVRLRSTQANAAAPNAAVVSFYGGFNLTTALRQTGDGVRPGELAAPNFALGPATVAQPMPLAGAAQLNSTATTSLKNRLQQLAASRAVRAFPLYASQGAPTAQFPIVGFVAAQVTAARVAEGRLVVELEPAYLIHFTAWTTAPNDPVNAQANLYIHKLRLVR